MAKIDEHICIHTMLSKSLCLKFKMCYSDTWAHFNFSITCMFWEYAAYHKTQQITNLKTAQLMSRNQGSRRYDYKVTKLLFILQTCSIWEIASKE